MISGALSFPISLYPYRTFVEIFTFVASTVHPRKLGGRLRFLAAPRPSFSRTRSLALSCLMGVNRIRRFPAGPEVATTGFLVSGSGLAS